MPILTTWLFYSYINKDFKEYYEKKQIIYDKDKEKDDEKKLEQVKISLINNILDEKEICFLCVSNIRQIIFSNCGHKHLCLLCFEKLKIKNSTNSRKCPVCNVESTEFINDFE